MRPLAALLVLAALGCKREANVMGVVTRSDGQPVVRAFAVLRCPGEPKRQAPVDATGTFRFEDVGAGVDRTCTVEIEGPGIGGAEQPVANHCKATDPKSGLCTETRFEFVL